MGQLKFRTLLARSSLGSPDAKRVRAETPRSVASRIVRQVSATDAAAARIGGQPVAQRRQAQGGTRTVSGSKNRHVVPNPGGGWDVKAPGAGRASSHHDTQADAERRAKEIVRNRGGGEVRIHGRDGRIRDSDTVAPGNDPNPPRDRRR